jgi:hypothetical protein
VEAASSGEGRTLTVSKSEASGLNVRTVLLPQRSWCDALWYAGALPADVLCVPLSAAQVQSWDRMLEHGIDPELEEFPRSVLIQPPCS